MEEVSFVVTEEYERLLGNISRSIIYGDDRSVLELFVRQLEWLVLDYKNPSSGMSLEEVIRQMEIITR